MPEEKKQRLTKAEGLEREREVNLKHWEERDAILMKRREEAYDIGGAAQAERLARQGKRNRGGKNHEGRISKNTC